MPILLTMPQEVLDLIGLSLSASAIASLAQTCRVLSMRLSRALHHHAISAVQPLPAIHWAVMKKMFPLIKYLLRDDPSVIHVIYNNRTPLHSALTTTPTTDILQLLLASGAAVNARGSRLATPLHLLCGRGGNTLEHLHLLLDHGANINLRDQLLHTPLMLAILFDQDDLAIALIAAGVDLKNLESFDKPPIFYAVTSSRRIPLLEALLDAGEDPNYRTRSGNTPMLVAVRRGSLDAVQLLLDRGANKDVVNDYGDSAVGLACMYGNEGVAMRLLHAGAVCNVRNEGGATPLSSAVKLGLSGVVEEMLKTGGYRREGEDLLAESLVVARSKGLERIVDLLEEESLKRAP